MVGASAGGMEALQKLVSRLPPRPARRRCSSSGTSRRARRASCRRSFPRPGRCKAVPPAGRRPDRAGAHLRRAERPPHAAREGLHPRRARAEGEPLPPGGRSAVPLGGLRLRAARDRRGADRRARRRHRGPVDHQAARRHRDRAGAGRSRCVRSMPLNALDNVEVDHKLPAAEIGALLGRLVREPAPAGAAACRTPRTRRPSTRCASPRSATRSRKALMRFGELCPFTCPECHGVLVDAARRARSCASAATPGTRSPPMRCSPPTARSSRRGCGTRCAPRRERDAAQPAGRGIRARPATPPPPSGASTRRARRTSARGRCARPRSAARELNVQNLREEAAG